MQKAAEIGKGVGKIRKKIWKSDDGTISPLTLLRGLLPSVGVHKK